jgi:hypothetical protein
MTEPDHPADPVLPVRPGNFLLELVLVPVSDIDRAKAFTPNGPGLEWTSTCGPPMASGSSS